MRLDLIEENQAEHMRNVLKTKYNAKDLERNLNFYQENLSAGASLYLIQLNSKTVGFLIASRQTIPDYDEKNIEVLVVEVLETIPEIEGDPVFPKSLASAIIKLSKSLKLGNVEFIVEKQNSWIIPGLTETRFSCVGVTMEKILPNPENIEDVLSLIHGAFSVPIVIQIIFRKGYDLTTEYMDTMEEVQDMIDDGWTPFAVEVGFDTEDADPEKELAESEKIIHWNDITYNFSYR